MLVKVTSSSGADTMPEVQVTFCLYLYTDTMMSGSASRTASIGRSEGRGDKGQTQRLREATRDRHRD